MATTIIGNMKQAKSGPPSAHLKNAIEYILDTKNAEKKTAGGKWIGGNAGLNAKEIHQAMLETKQDWDKLSGRQGYHFVISFSPEEKVNEQKAYDVIKDFCELYLGDHYDYVFAIHNDQVHMHGHIIFNSVCRTDGYKYRYVKGDWEKSIQPVTDEVCKKHGLQELTYEEKRVGKSYAEYMAEKSGRQTGKKIIQCDIDFAISRSDTWEEFIEQMELFDYQLREGMSEQKGAYITFTAPGAKNGRRSYNLGAGYSVADIKQRILQKDFKEIYQVRHDLPRLKKVWLQGNIRSGSMSRYQVRRVRRLFRAKNYRMLNPYAVNQSAARKDLIRINKLHEECRYLMHNNISSEKELLTRKRQLLDHEKILKGKRNTLYANEKNTAEEMAVKEYADLIAELSQGPADERADQIQDRMEELEAVYPDAVLLNMNTKEQAGEELKALRKELRIVNRILKDDEYAPQKLKIKSVNRNKETGKEGVKYGRAK